MHVVYQVQSFAVHTPQKGKGQYVHQSLHLKFILYLMAIEKKWGEILNMLMPYLFIIIVKISGILRNSG